MDSVEPTTLGGTNTSTEAPQNEAYELMCETVMESIFLRPITSASFGSLYVPRTVFR